MLISKEIENALIDGVSIITSKRIKEIILDLNMGKEMSKNELFLIGFELGKLYVFESETKTYGGNLEAKVYELVGMLSSVIDEE